MLVVMRRVLPAAGEMLWCTLPVLHTQQPLRHMHPASPPLLMVQQQLVQALTGGAAGLLRCDDERALQGDCVIGHAQRGSWRQALQ